jgi:hypothetical protein
VTVVHEWQEVRAASGQVGMKRQETSGQEKTMTPIKHRISFSFALAAIVAGLVFSAGASARVPVEPGQGSPVTHKQPRHPAVKKSLKRNQGGFPSLSGQHVKSQAELRTE